MYVPASVGNNVSVIDTSANVTGSTFSGINNPVVPQNQSGFMLANFTTLPHFSVSSAMSFPKAGGELAFNRIWGLMQRGKDVHDILLLGAYAD
jgi:hypothetical protein